MSVVLTDRVLLWLSAGLYVAGFVSGVIALALRRDTPASRAILNALLTGGLFLQICGLYLRGLSVGGCPLGNKFELVQFVVWSAMVLYFVVGTTFRVSLLGLFTAGYAASLAVISLLVPEWDGPARLKLFGENPWIELHAALAVFSYGVFGLLAITAVMHLLQNWSLKNKRLNGLFWFLPSVVQLDQINFRLLATGVVLLSISLGVGASWWLRDTASADPAKLTVTVGIWLCYTAALVLRALGRLVSARLAWACVALFALALLSLGPVNQSRHAPPAGYTR